MDSASFCGVQAHPLNELQTRWGERYRAALDDPGLDFRVYGLKHSAGSERGSARVR